jgi:hypothetical protein
MMNKRSMISLSDSVMPQLCGISHTHDGGHVEGEANLPFQSLVKLIFRHRVGVALKCTR